MFNKFPNTRNVSNGRSFDMGKPGTACEFENKFAINSRTDSTI